MFLHTKKDLTNAWTIHSINGIAPTRHNYMALNYQRVNIPSCAICGTLCFEDIEFESDTTLIVTHNVFDAKDFSIYKKFLFGADTVYRETFRVDGDTLWGELEDEKQNYMVLTFKGDTLELTTIRVIDR
jgi:hypothetical protein